MRLLPKLPFKARPAATQRSRAVPRAQALASRYATALAFAAAALLLNRALFAVTDRSSAFLSECAVATAAVIGGFGPGVLSTALSAAGLELLFLSRWHEDAFEFHLRILVFAASSLLLAFLGSTLRKSLLETKKARLEAESAVRARDELIATISHEMKTPLTALKLQSQLARKTLNSSHGEGVSRPTLENMTKAGESAVARIDAFVNEMLELAQVSNCRIVLHPSEIDLASFLGEIAGRFQLETDQKGIAVHTKLTPGIHGYWDRSRLDRVVTNLLSNAIKYGNRSPITIHSFLDRGFAHIILEDHGKGIARHNLEKIFDSFERAEASEAIEGHGLGLYISKKIVTRFGGRIWAESDPGCGASFHVLIPLEAPPTSPPGVSSPDNGRAARA